MKKIIVMMIAVFCVSLGCSVAFAKEFNFEMYCTKEDDKHNCLLFLDREYFQLSCKDNVSETNAESPQVELKGCEITGSSMPNNKEARARRELEEEEILRKIIPPVLPFILPPFPVPPAEEEQPEPEEEPYKVHI